MGDVTRVMPGMFRAIFGWETRHTYFRHDRSWPIYYHQGHHSWAPQMALLALLSLRDTTSGSRDFWSSAVILPTLLLYCCKNLPLYGEGKSANPNQHLGAEYVIRGPTSSEKGLSTLQAQKVQGRQNKLISLSEQLQANGSLTQQQLV